jgi:hypothetical protein
MLPEANMTTEDKMTTNERYKYLRRMQKRYQQATHQERSRLLDEMEQVTDLHRKSLIRHMNGTIERRPRRKQRGRIYGPEVDDALRVIAETHDYICAERLTPSLPQMAQQLAIHGELRTTPELLAQLESISISTVRRILSRIRQNEPRLPRRAPGAANHIARQIPIARIPWDEQTPGHLEVDLVHHCGPATAGEYVHTLQLIDVATGWSERVAILGRSYLVMADAFRYILQRIPFPILGLHPDNGSEFLNAHLLRFWRAAIPEVDITRSRPYHNNDNRFVEQKNDTLVRAFFGNDRLDSVAQVVALNQLYHHMWVYHNLFQPVMRLAEKTYVSQDDGPSRVKRRHDTARTPFHRLCATDAISAATRTQMETLHYQTNPRQLRRAIYDGIEHLFSLPAAVSGQTEDVYATLFFPHILDGAVDGVDNSENPRLAHTIHSSTATNNGLNRMPSVTFSFE